MADNKRFTLARKEKQNADLIRKQNEARIFLTSLLNEDIEEEDMSVALQDGVLLCKLINRFKPDSIKKFNMNPRIAFKMMENAAYVLDFCKKNAIPVTFTAENICNKEHVILILGFILTIAERMGWTPQAPEHSPSPAPESSSSPRGSAPPQPFHSQDTARGTASPVQSQLQEPALSPRGFASAGFRSTPPSTLSSPARSNAKPAANFSANTSANSVKAVIDELISSERDFLQDMEIFVRLIVQPSRNLIPTDRANAIFGNIDNILAANNRLLHDLEKAQDGFVSISSVWANFSSAINVYSVYCIFQQNSYGALEQCRREIPNFDAHLRSVEYTPESKNGNTFNFLVKPFSRVVKYNSVLKQLLQGLTAGTEDYESIVDLKKQFQDLSDTTSETWKKVENSRKIAEISGKLMGAEKAGLRKLGRIYLREGDFILNGKTVRLYLFSDIIVHAVPVKAILGGKKSGGKSHIFKGIIPLNASSFQDLPDAKDAKNQMELTTSEKAYKIQALSPSDKRLWVTDITKCIAKLNSSHSRELPSNPSPLEPRPQLDVGRRPAPGRMDSQNQVVVEERRKTVKLAFGSKGGDDSDEDKYTVVEEVENVQLELKPGGVPQTEEDKRKTIKLEFGHQQRQLSIRDRSKTVELTINKPEKEDSGEAPEAAEVEEPQLIVDRRKTVKLAFHKESPPPPSDSPSEQMASSEQGDVSPTLDANQYGEEMRESQDSLESRDSQIADSGEPYEKEESEVEDAEAQNQDILSTDEREDIQEYYESDDVSDSGNQDTGHGEGLPADSSPPLVVADGASANQNEETRASYGNLDPQTVEVAYAESEESLIDQEEVQESKGLLADAQLEYQADSSAETQSGAQAEPSDVQAEVPAPTEPCKLDDQFESQVGSQVENQADLQGEGQFDGAIADQLVEAPLSDLIDASLESPSPAKESTTVLQDTNEATHDQQANGSVDLDDKAAFGIAVDISATENRRSTSPETNTEVVLLRQEVQTLKDELWSTQEQLQQLIKEQAQEREENKAWKTRVERILLDVMQLKNG